MHNNDEAELRAQVRSEVKTDKLPEPLRYLPNIANLAQDIDGLAHKIRGVPTALLNHALDGLAHDIKKLQASTRESLDALAEPSKVTAKNLESLGRGTGDRRQLHRTTKRQLARNAGIFGKVGDNPGARLRPDRHSLHRHAQLYGVDS